MELSEKKAINLTTLKVTFNKSVDPVSAVNPANYKLEGTPLNTTSAPNLSLSKDGKSVTITLNTPLTNKAQAKVTVSAGNAIKTTSNEAIKEVTNLYYVEDVTKPTADLVGYNHAANTFTVNFDETIKNNSTALTDATVTVKKADGTVVTTPSYTTDGTNFVLNTSSLDANTTYTVTIEGAKDLAGNYFEGNKLSYTFTKAASETVKPEVKSVEAVNATTLKVTFSEKLGDAGKLKAGAGTATALTKVSTLSADYNYTVDETGLVYTIKVPTMTTNTITPYEFSEQKDLSGNTIDTVTKSVSYIKDSVAPEVASISVLGQIATITFNEDVDVTPAAFTVLSPSSVLTSLVAGKIASLNTVLGTTIYPTKVQVDLSSLVAENGTYTINLPKGIVADKTGNSKDYQIKTSLNGADTTAPEVTTPAPAVSGNKVTVNYSEAMDASAIDVNNYTVDGKKVFESAYFDGAKNKVILTIKDGSFDSTANRQLTIDNVKDVAGNKIAEAYTKELSFNDNTQPTITSAKLGTDYKTITVTYTKALDALSVQEASAEADYKVLVGGTEVTVAAEAVSGNTVTLTLATALNATQYAQAITIAPTADFDVTFGTGNAITNFTSYTVAK